MSGKTTLAQKIVEEHRKAGFGILVFDPMDDPDWKCDRQFTQFEPFLECAYKATRCLLVVEECGTVVGQYPKPRVEWLGTRARHWGHRTLFIGQAPVQISATMREQCATLFAFKTNKRRAQMWADEFIDDDILKAQELEQYQFIHKVRFQPCKIQKLKI